MFAIVTMSGFQEMVSEGDTLRISKLHAEPGDTVSFDEVLLISTGKDAVVGNPTIAGASVEVKVIAHGRDTKIRVFKMLRRKRFRKTQGHRQHFTEVEVLKINASGTKKVAAKKEEVKEPVAKKATATK